MTRRNIKLLVTLLLCAALCLGAAAALAAGESTTYVERSWNGTQVVSETKTVTAVPVPSNGNMTSGWYILDSNVTKNGRVESITGDVHLILGDGFALDVKGLYVPAGTTLTIYGQSAGTGRLYSHPSGGAAIGGYSGHDNGNIVIHGGTIEATGYDHCAGIGSNDGKTGGAITIYGGEITATGGSDGAGIGGGRNCDGGNITIYSGTITAHGGGENGAGIGGGDSGDGGTIVIWGGTITANEDPNENGAGIGGGYEGAGGNITIYGGTITTYSRDGAGIGGGDDGNGGSITINGGTITSTKVNNGQGARIGGGCDAAPGTIIIDGGSVTTVGGSGAGIGGGKGNTSGGSVTINGGVINASGSYGIGSGENGADVAVTLGYYGSTRANIRITASSFGGTVTLAAPFVMSSTGRYFQPGLCSDVSLLSDGALTSWDGAGVMDVAYVNAAGADMGTQTCIPVTEASIVWLEGWYAVTGNVSINTRIQVSGTVNLILADGASLNAAKGISLPQGSHLIIWAQSGGTGALTATGSERYYAGIGGYIVDGGVMSENYGSLTINGGHITATGGEGAAGIGTSYGRSSVLTVNGGEVTATGGKYASGIGAGVDPNEGTSYTYYNCYFGGAYFYGGKTTANSGVDHNGNVLKPIGAGCALTGYSDAFFLNDGMKVLHADIGHMSYDERYCSISSVWYGDNWVIIEPQTEGSVAYTVTVENNDTNGTLSVNTSMAHAGTEVTVSCTPNTGYELDAITVTDGSGNAVSVTNNKFTMPASHVTVSAALRKIDYTVTVNASGLGAVTANCATANYGDTVTLSFAPNDEDCFLSTFTIKDAGNHDIAFDEQTNSFVMPASNVTVTAVYSKTRFRITVNDSEYGSVTAPEKANVGDTVTLTVTPYENCRLVSITAVDAGGSAVAVDQNACTFTMPEANVTITPVFETSYPISIAQDIEHGTITAAQRAYAGDTVTLTPVPDAGYGLVAGSYVLTDAPAVTVAADGSFTMPAQAVTASAAFEALDQTLNLSISGAEFGSYTVSVNGTERITVTENTSITVRTDDTITVTCVPKTDGRLNRLSVDGTVQENNSCTFVMPPSAATVSVEFETVFRALGLALNGGQYGDYKVSVNGVERATASTATENLIVRVGDEITVTFLPAADGQVEVFYLEDSVGSGEQHHESDILNNQYTFTMPARPIDMLWANVRFGVRNATETVSYIDENGAEQTVTATVLSGNETENYLSTSSGFYYYTSLGNGGDAPTWYVVKQNVSFYHNESFSRNIELTGDVHIIVADGATLTVQGEIKDGSLRVYGQTNQTGSLTAGSINYCGSLTVCSGGLTVNGNVSCQNLAIYGGTTAITGAANASESVILGCRSNGDSISFGTLTKGYGASAAVVTGQTLTDGARDYSGDLSDSDLSAMANRTLMKAHTHEISEMQLIQAVAPTYDPATGEYADGTREHYHCAICGGDFVEVSGSLEPVADLSLPYFVFWRMPSVSGVCYLRAYNGADDDVIIPETVPASLASASAPADTVITQIDSEVFAGHTELETVTAGSGLCSIGAGAFAGCTALTDFTTTAAQAVSYVYNDTNGLQDSFASVTNLTIHATHASELYQAAVDYGFTFIVTDRHSEPTWTWAEDLSSATATFECNGTCQLGAPDNTVTDDSPTVTVGEDGTVYTASVTVGGEVYSDTKTAADTWAQLQAQINAASNGATITLYRNITALAGNGGLVIPQNKDITLNLNGFTLDRHLSEAAYNGQVITVAYGATLTLTGNGTITGGNSLASGGGVIVAAGAVLNLNSGSITGNSASAGGGVYLEPEATLNMTAGNITGNTAETAGGVYVTSTHQEYESGNTVTRNKSIIRLSGSPVITGNTGGNVYLADGQELPVIEVTAALSSTAAIGVTAGATGVFTSGWAEKMSGNDPEDTFVSDNAGFMVFTDSTGEAAIDSCWQRLQAQINAASNGATITLDRNITALAGNGGLVIPQNKAVTLDLNGFTLDRHLSEAVYGGQVITVAYGATLTLTGNGTITGGKSRGYGGGVVVANGAVLNLNSGSITGNSASVGGGVYLEPEATLNMTAGNITGNTAETAGGVYVTSTHQEYESGNTVTRNKSIIRLSGSPVITGNTGGNVYLADGQELPVIEVTAALSNAASIGVTAQAGVFTNGLNGGGDTPNGTAANFFSDSDDYLVALNAAGEAMLETAHTVTFEPGDENASGYMPEMRVGSAMTLPACDYSVEGKVFKEWSVKVGDNESVRKQPGDTVEVTADTTVTAVWQEITFGTPDFVVPGGVTIIEDNAFEGIAATVVEIPGGCTHIGNEAFMNCTHLTMIRIPAGCTLGTDVFDGCGTVYVLAPAGSAAEAYCLSHSNCVFVPVE